MDTERHEHLIKFYSILDKLEKKIGGVRKLADCSGQLVWPARGIYFFREPGESRFHTGTGPRIARVGTHALTATSRTSLWNRLSQHRGSAKTGGGNHRGSIFRLLVGEALIARDQLDVPTWNSKSANLQMKQTEHALECTVSQIIGEMSFLWLPIEDASSPEKLRGYIERNSIALLSNYHKENLDPPSAGWLGHHSKREKVTKSGLWNQNHVEEPYDIQFLITLEHLIPTTATQT
jgi:hypothetical protein